MFSSFKYLSANWITEPQISKKKKTLSKELQAVESEWEMCPLQKE